jgi:hypothetical protein
MSHYVGVIGSLKPPGRANQAPNWGSSKLGLILGKPHDERCAVINMTTKEARDGKMVGAKVS